MLQPVRVIDPFMDVAPLLAELEKRPDRWLVNTSRQEQIRCQRDTQTIFLRTARKPFPPDTPGSEVHATADTKESTNFPRAMAAASQIADRMNGELGRVMIVRLKPGGKIYAHKDQGAYYRVRNRFHLILQAGEGCLLRCQDATVATRAGQLSIGRDANISSHHVIGSSLRDACCEVWRLGPGRRIRVAGCHDRHGQYRPAEAQIR